jgi:hypothetical protein
VPQPFPNTGFRSFLFLGFIGHVHSPFALKKIDESGLLDRFVHRDQPAAVGKHRLQLNERDHFSNPFHDVIAGQNARRLLLYDKKQSLELTGKS